METRPRKLLGQVHNVIHRKQQRTLDNFSGSFDGVSVSKLVKSILFDTPKIATNIDSYKFYRSNQHYCSSSTKR
jgi:hypothetical protein